MVTRKIIIVFVCLLLGAGVIMAENKDIVVSAKSVTTNERMTVGFRIELINSGSDNNLVLFMRSSPYQFTVRLFDENGVDVSPALQTMPADKAIQYKSDNKSKYDIVAPGASRVWFISVPSQVRIDKTNDSNENNLQLIPNGKYMAEIKVNVPYFTLDKKEKVLSGKHDFKILRLTLPRVPIEIDSGLLNQDIEKIYQVSQAWSSVVPLPAAFAEDNKSALQDFLEIKVEKSIADEDYRSKQIPLKISLINTGNTPLHVPQFDLNSPYEVSTFFRFNFLEEDNVTLYSDLFESTKHKKQEQKFVELAPGKSLDFSIDVSRIIFPRPEPGKYKVAVEYLNRNDKNKLIVVKCSPPLLLEILRPDEKMREGYITKAEAIEIAKDAIKEKIKYDESLKPAITLDRGIYTVIFPIYVPLGTFGPDYAGKVEIDAKSKNVLRVSMGS